jgi:hypothetical protein
VQDEPEQIEDAVPKLMDFDQICSIHQPKPWVLLALPEQGNYYLKWMFQLS